jgi:hypothetical protein
MRVLSGSLMSSMVGVTAVAAALGLPERSGRPHEGDAPAAAVASTGSRFFPSSSRATAGFFSPPSALFESAPRRSPAGYCEPQARTVFDLTSVAQRRSNSSDNPAFHEFYFTRAIYSDWRMGGGYLGDSGPSWSIDYPKGDEQFITVIQRLLKLDACEWENPVDLADPDIRRFPFIYTLEVGFMALQPAERKGLHDYLMAGGFLVIDDFWGSEEWRNFEREISLVLPDAVIKDVPKDHLIWRIFYDIDELMQVPNVRNGQDVASGYPGAVTYEKDGYQPQIKGIFDNKGRLMVVINWNTDLGDAWEHAELPSYPLKFSTFACQLGMNMILYGMTQ